MERFHEPEKLLEYLYRGKLQEQLQFNKYAAWRTHTDNAGKYIMDVSVSQQITGKNWYLIFLSMDPGAIRMIQETYTQRWVLHINLQIIFQLL